jgi:hypothetical protein
MEAAGEGVVLLTKAVVENEAEVGASEKESKRVRERVGDRWAATQVLRKKTG